MLTACLSFASYHFCGVEFTWVPLARLQMLTLTLWKSQSRRCVRKRCQQSIFCAHQIRRSSNYTKQTVLFSGSNSMSF